MRSIRVMVLVVGILLVGWILMILFRGRLDSRDLNWWLSASRSRDWSVEASQGDPKAQFLHGLSLIRTNLVIMIDRIPYLSAVPVIGRRFEKITAQIDYTISAQRLEESRRWIEQSAAKGFLPAMEARRLFPAMNPTPTGSRGNGGISTNSPAGD